MTGPVPDMPRRHYVRTDAGLFCRLCGTRLEYMGNGGGVRACPFECADRGES